MRLHIYRHYLTRDIPEPNREFNRGGRRGTRRRIKTLAFLCVLCGYFLDRKYRIAIRRPISIHE
jgi:hypothetical protein